jgi:hypothetical protein
MDIQYALRLAREFAEKYLQVIDAAVEWGIELVSTTSMSCNTNFSFKVSFNGQGDAGVISISLSPCRDLVDFLLIAVNVKGCPKQCKFGHFDPDNVEQAFAKF